MLELCREQVKVESTRECWRPFGLAPSLVLADIAAAQAIKPKVADENDAERLE
jgi:hypothetical protein